MDLSPPLIGICGVATTATWGFWSQQAVLTAQTYLDAVIGAGGQPLILPPSVDADVARLVNLLDGIVLAGGTDIAPGHYGETASAQTEETHPVRDAFELRLTAAVLEHDIPVLGICRGLQILNVATGGTLHQHLLDAGFTEHRPAPGRLDATTRHAVEIDADSVLGRCGLAGVREVNSHHHQGVSVIGKGGRIIATALPDRSVEAVEWPRQRFALGVQWHPEDPPMHAIFAEFVAAAALLTEPVTPVGAP
ncbi:gamma-glutamyl-gamma-aminobutyrate hydrolase family protein [Mycobacterium sp. 21AC1]|uniref:gamma-glutamyl-gamma-aminobutyrate hydrolase family protein n=1 Tax=[Mycobacterium] appelbergii TaxID=2939269 RepID=UPI0029394DCE|nr:gamma-glutamyl-gamma-aminobutyrate hydrolase family protein [Mycobacterium sp. 21AC1]MDV3126846.1 gamma-glutamyl-gamma-aminobutyrate hydrolase family protein [Mycobacterium sp. 21AC1]